MSLSSDPPLYVTVTNELCENLISKLQGRDLILPVLHIDEEHIFTRLNHTGANNLSCISHQPCMLES